MLAILLGACSSTEPAAPESHIAFVAFESEAINLFSMNADGSDVRRLTDDSLPKESPSWSPDGRKLVFAANGSSVLQSDIYTVNADGSGLRKILSNGADNRAPDWSPDGRRIAFTSFRADDQGVVVEPLRIWVMQADGSGGTPLVEGAGPSWSPDSRRLVFVRSIPGTGLETALFLMGSDGSGEVQLTNPLPTADSDFDPEWSPTGSHIAFTRIDYSGAEYSVTLWVIRPDGTDLKQLGGPSLQPYHPSWSPDGTEIVFSDGNDGQLKVVSLESTTIRVFPSLPAAYNDSPDWGPER